MPRRRARWSLLLGATLLVAACGGGTSPTAAPGGATVGPGGGGTTPAPVATQNGGGGGSISGVCELLTAGEIESILGVTGVTSQETAIISESGACVYVTGDGGLAVALSFTGTAAGGQMVFDTWKQQAGAVTVDGIGGEAVFLPDAATLFLFKNNKLIGIQAGAGDADIDQRKAWEIELAKKISGRL